MKLYEITEDMRELHQMAEAGELTHEQIADTLEGLGLQFDDKARNVLIIRAEMLGNVAKLDAEIDRLAELKKAQVNSAEHLTEYLKQNMIALKKDSLSLGIFKVTLRKAGLMLGTIDETKIPEYFWTEIPASRKYDRNALLKLVKETPIAGIEMVDASRGLTIK
jgi:hypothetical protein